jgi:DnaJ-class molecular chaperone
MIRCDLCKGRGVFHAHLGVCPMCKGTGLNIDTVLLALVFLCGMAFVGVVYAWQV